MSARSDYGLIIPASAFTDDGKSVYTASIRMFEGEYALPFGMACAWISAMEVQDAQTLWISNPRGDYLGGQFPGRCADVQIRFPVHYGQDWTFTYYAPSLASANPLSLIFSISHS